MESAPLCYVGKAIVESNWYVGLGLMNILQVVYAQCVVVCVAQYAV